MKQRQPSNRQPTNRRARDQRQRGTQQPGESQPRKAQGNPGKGQAPNRKSQGQPGSKQPRPAQAQEREPRWTQTWLGGTRSAGVDLGYPGERLGLPQDGPGAVAGFGRRIGAILVDWMICTWAIARGIFQASPQDASWIGMAVFAAAYILLVGTLGMTLGMRLFKIRIAALDGSQPTLLAVLIRTFLLCLAVPALIWDRDQRGLHDRAAGTVAVRL
ncbi:RDD family protein [Acrocarpospora sp. B8E8]|uniref:RDD family protein n=1 Tax=Acrocarpospora sp. B8E8 TaxID=3153572 RepID=UPI00325CE9FA